MSAQTRLERDYRVRFDEAGPDGMLPASGFLRFAQDLAWLHSESAGFGRDWYTARGLTWLVRAIELDLVADIEYGSSVSVSTEVIGFRRVWARRRSEFTSVGSGRAVAVAITDWVLLNDRLRPIRPPDDILAAFSPTAEEFTPIRLRATDPPADAECNSFEVRRSELDPMEHVNNAAYLDYLDELYVGEGTARRLPLPRRYRAEFLSSAEAGAALIGRGWRADDTWTYLLEGADGAPMLRASLEADPASWVGG